MPSGALLENWPKLGLSEITGGPKVEKSHVGNTSCNFASDQIENGIPSCSENLSGYRK